VGKGLGARLPLAIDIELLDNNFDWVGLQMSLNLYNIFRFSSVIAQYKPTDATTNPSLLYAAAQLPEYNHLFDDAIKFAKDTSGYRR
jgi:transaldolase